MAKHLSCVIESASHFLETRQWPGGFWIDFELFVGMSSQWVTAYVAHCLERAKPDSPSLNLAQKWLLRTENLEGGWGFNRDVPPDADSTANVLFFLAKHHTAPTDPAILIRAAETLLKYQCAEDGGFATYLPRIDRPGKPDSKFIYPGSGWCISHLSVTALSAIALEAVSRDLYTASLQAAMNFVLKKQSPQGYYHDHWWYDLIYGTCWATRFLLLMGEKTAPLRACAWLAGASRNGAWTNGIDSDPSAFHTALALTTLMQMGAFFQSGSLVEDGVNWLIANQLDDGSWESIPVLLTPIPEILDPQRSSDASSRNAVADQNRQFTTATVLSALSEFSLRR